MKKRFVQITALSALVLVVALSALLATRHDAPGATQVRSPLLGHRAPTFAGATLSGSRLSLAGAKGKYVVLNFWASWCGPCQQEAPELSTFAWQERGSNVEVVGVLYQDYLSAADSFVRTYGTRYPTVIDTNGSIANSYGVTAPPTTFIISPGGVVVGALVGAATVSQLTSLLATVGA